MEEGNTSKARYEGNTIDHLKWSPAEKALARKVFDGALARELNSVIEKTKQMAGNIKTPSDVWKIEAYLTRSRKEIDSKYDYRYSRLPLVFGRLVRERRITQDELNGLGEDKLRYVRSLADY